MTEQTYYEPVKHNLHFQSRIWSINIFYNWFIGCTLKLINKRSILSDNHG